MKTILKLSVIVIFLFFFGCAPSQLMNKSLMINAGQTKEDVLKILGNPGNRQFQGKDEAWQWCETDYSGFAGDDYLVVWFYEGKVTGITTYKNTRYGNCEMFYRTVNWQDAPDRTIEIRNR